MLLGIVNDNCWFRCELPVAGFAGWGLVSSSRFSVLGSQFSVPSSRFPVPATRYSRLIGKGTSSTRADYDPAENVASATGVCLKCCLENQIRGTRNSLLATRYSLLATPDPQLATRYSRPATHREGHEFHSCRYDPAENVASATGVWLEIRMSGKQSGTFANARDKKNRGRKW
jgi:hypothetical protein